MCGICGIHGIERLDQPRELIRKMNASIAHRGPDASGEYISDEIALGHQRLSIIDLSAAANQPMHSADGNLVLVFNGELYNYQELRAKLSDYPFLTNGDTEVVLAAFQQWGIDAVQRFNGMFSIALWNDQKKELFLIRDRLGIKPLYYAEVGQTVVFASEIRAVLASGLVTRKANAGSIIDYLRYQTVHAPDTIIDGVRMLLPGTFLHITDSDSEVYPYWSLTSNVQSQRLSPAETKNQVANLLEQSVKRRLVADVPFGAFLSGGIDSSVIVGLMARNHTAPVKTFSVTFEEEAFSEAPFARMIADRFSTEHQEIKLMPTDFLDDLPDALSAMDHPSGDGPNTFIVSSVTKQAGISMALSGTGGDELFAGYDIFKRVIALQDKRWLLSFPGWMRAFGGNLLRRFRPGIASDKTAAVMQAGYFDLEYIYWVSRLLFFDDRIRKILNHHELSANRVFGIVGDQLEYGTPGFQLPQLSQVSIAEISTYLQNVLLRDTDQMSMAHALEVRVPFMDHELVEFVLGIPDDIKYPHQPKKLLIDSFPDLLPPEIVNRPKMGFTFPWAQWLKRDLRDFTGDHLTDLSNRKMFSQKGIQQLWSDFDQEKPDINWAHIWNLVVLEHWLQKNRVDV